MPREEGGAIVGAVDGGCAAVEGSERLVSVPACTGGLHSLVAKIKGIYS